MYQLVQLGTRQRVLGTQHLVLGVLGSRTGTRHLVLGTRSLVVGTHRPVLGTQQLVKQNNSFFLFFFFFLYFRSAMRGTKFNIFWSVSLETERFSWICPKGRTPRLMSEGYGKLYPILSTSIQSATGKCKARQQDRRNY